VEKLSPEKKKILAEDPIRNLVFTRAVELGKSLKALSRTVRRNDAYLHQYLWRGSPTALPEAVRSDLAAVLGVPQESLMTKHMRDHVRGGVTPNSPKPNLSALDTELRDPINLSDVNEIPVYNCPGRLAAVDKSDLVRRPADYAGMGAVFAVWVAETVGRLQPGDLAFVRPSQPARPGDSVVVTRHERLVSLGQLVERNGKNINVNTAQGNVTYVVPEHDVLKIAIIACP